MNYRTKPVEIQHVEAYQYTPSDAEATAALILWLEAQGFKVERMGIDPEFPENEEELYVTREDYSGYLFATMWVYKNEKLFGFRSASSFLEKFELDN